MSPWSRARVAALAALAWAALPAAAHEVRPAYLEVREDAPGELHVLFKRPVRGGRGLPLQLRFPAGCAAAPTAYERVGSSALVERTRLVCPEDGDATFAVEGLRASLTDVAVRVERADGSQLRTLLRPDAPAFAWKGAAPSGLPAWFRLGVEHLAFGLDHVLFVLCLLFFLDRVGPLVRAITAFTLAHSITLAASALGAVRVPQEPVEALIALSILMLAVEKLRGGGDTLTSRHTWLVALVFGLVHGFGFAGAIAEIGLPRGERLAALGLFNVGIELGQLAIVAVALLLVAGLRRIPGLPAVGLARASLYGIGSLAGFWVVERVLGLV